jgi:sterol desaturase/sphingolipid hydroxylase (fatty acid hydroxylase superfamily)
MTSLLVWFLNIVLSDEFMLMSGMFVFVGLAEYWFAARQVPRHHYALNLRYAFITVFVVGAMTPFLSAGVAYSLQKIGFGFVDLGALGLSGAWGDLLAVLVGALIWDFFQYWEHRLLHGSPLLWQMHLLHHCDEHMNITTASRHHVLEHLLAPVFVTIPAAIIFDVPPVNIAIMSLLPYAWNYLAHSNINLGFGPFWWLLVSPNCHRVHHSMQTEHIDQNFVNWFPIWDITFGTAVNPRWRQCPSTGVAGVLVNTVSQAYLQPLQGWARMFSQRKRNTPRALNREQTLTRA